GSLSDGFHRLYIRSKGSAGNWSIAERSILFVQGSTFAQNVVAYQYYVDNDPGPGVTGNGAVVPVASTSDFNQTIALQLPSLAEGVHNLYIRTKSNNNAWAISERRMFLIQRNTQNVIAMEYYFDSDPGTGNAYPISVSSSPDINAVYPLGVPCLFAGQH